MKNKTLKKVGTLFLFLLCIGIQSTQAQFWKKLEKRATEAAEEAILRKTEDKAVEKAENAMDSIFDAPSKAGKKRKRKKSKNEDSNSSEEMNDAYEGYDEAEETMLPDTYNFEWKYALKMESEAMQQNENTNGDMKMTYYLNTDNSVFGTLIDMPTSSQNLGKTIMIMDVDNGINLMLMEMNGQKIRQSMPSMITDNLNEAIDEDMNKDYKVEKTDIKTILGYICQGFKITTEEGIVKTYIANNVPVSFNNIISSNSNFKPKGFDTKWLKEFENGLMMEMEFTSNKKEKYNMKMTCVELEETPISINLGEYKSLMEMGQ